MGFRRRRNHGRWVIPAVPATVAMSAAALLLFGVVAFYSFLAPPLLDHPPLPNPPYQSGRARSWSLLLKNPVELQKNVAGADAFRVNDGGGKGDELWGSELSKYFYGCSNATSGFATTEAITHLNRYLMIATSGGLNQQRTGIINAVVVARILNATLVVPKLDKRSFWQDASHFSEIFDVDWFITSLSKDVKIIKQLPKQFAKAAATPYSMLVPRKCSPQCYHNRVLPALLKKHVVQLKKFDYRLSNKLETDLQKLRCRVNYHALKFTDPILEMGKTLIRRMKGKGGHFIALHLRFEPDMLAFSGCYYGGGEKERKELGAIRKRWKTLHMSNPEKERRHGKCPLTPEEVGYMLRALGFSSDVHIYVASGEVYGGEDTLAPLKALFPNFHSKETLASQEELAPFLSFSSRMAALDFIVCDGSDAFVTNNNGNMAKILAGRRRYYGHKRTIRPNAKKLYSLFLNRTSMTWDAFTSKILTFQKGFMGEPNEVRPGTGEFHENPLACICESSKMSVDSTSHIQTHDGSENDKGYSSNSAGDRNSELDWKDLDYGENAPLGSDLTNGKISEDDIFIRSEDSSFEELISD
ncbi:protein ROOT HAIR SPECIFIC 17-like isoform X1 [Typha latifolia]|uniref:protein ROOT HAIR SPECIFIC 17-like isoform X1 n=1 Tax=Typha latifolia TaxID=4733 RepID=UPI003C2BDC31